MLRVLQEGLLRRRQVVKHDCSYVGVSALCLGHCVVSLLPLTLGVGVARLLDMTES